MGFEVCEARPPVRGGAVAWSRAHRGRPRASPDSTPARAASHGRGSLPHTPPGRAACRPLPQRVGPPTPGSGWGRPTGGVEGGRPCPKVGGGPTCPLSDPCRWACRFADQLEALQVIPASVPADQELHIGQVGHGACGPPVSPGDAVQPSMHYPEQYSSGQGVYSSRAMHPMVYCIMMVWCIILVYSAEGAPRVMGASGRRAPPAEQGLTMGPCRQSSEPSTPTPYDGRLPVGSPGLPPTRRTHPGGGQARPASSQRGARPPSYEPAVTPRVPPGSAAARTPGCGGPRDPPAHR